MTLTTTIMFHGGDIREVVFTTCEGWDGGEMWLMSFDGGATQYAVIDVFTHDPSTYSFGGVELTGADMGAIYAYLNLADAMV